MGVPREALALWSLVGAVEMGAWCRARGDQDTAQGCAAHVDLLVAHLP
jgi:hypothetical protein